jgi:hypothetical protein
MDIVKRISVKVVFGYFHSPAQTEKKNIALRTVLDSHLSRSSHSNPTCGRSRGTKSKRLILCPILGDAPHRRSSSDTTPGLALSCYRSVWISQAASVGLLR